MNKSDEYFEPKDFLYTKLMADKLSAISKDKKPVNTAQCASTQAILDRPIDKDEEWRNRPMAPGWEAPREVNHAFDPAQIVIVEGMRRESKNTQGDAISMGESSVTEEAREKAISAFTCSPPAELTHEQKLIAQNNVLEKIEKADMSKIIQTMEIPIKMPASYDFITSLKWYHWVATAASFWGVVLLVVWITERKGVLW